MFTTASMGDWVSATASLARLPTTFDASLMPLSANTLTSLGFVFGTTAGAKILLFAPAVQRINPVYEDRDGRTLVGMDLRLLPSASTGNDELKIVTL